MTIFYFVRHGETIINHEKRFNGGCVDSPLTAQGILGAESTGKLLQQVRFDQMVSSSLPRAQRTARIILKRNFHCYPEYLAVDHRLREVGLGDWDGQKITAVADDPQFYNYFNHPDRFNADLIHAESFESLLARAQAVIQDYTKPENHKVLIVSHGSLLLFLINALTGGTLAEVRKHKMLANSSVTILRARSKAPFETLGFNITPDAVAKMPAIKPFLA